ncbi:MAG TPA: hypothetical protein VJ719_08675 [Chthoniobacterales bacterium]|nr:hypothetical protein [Chthoniobacterales bacterium]
MSPPPASPPPVPPTPVVVQTTAAAATPPSAARPIPGKPILILGVLVLLGALVVLMGRSKPAGTANNKTVESGQITSSKTSPSTGTGTGTTSTAPPLGPTNGNPTNGNPSDEAPFLARGVQLFTHNFQTPKPIFTPLFGSDVMTAARSDGEGRLDGFSPGIMPAMLGKFMLNDFVVECDMRPGSVPPGAGYGFILRSADVQQGGISAYYTIILMPNENYVGMNCWNNGSFVVNEQRYLPRGIIQPGKSQRLAVSALGSEIAVYLDDQFVGKFNDATLSEGRLGLCLAGASTGTCTVYFDNFTIYMPP